MRNTKIEWCDTTWNPISGCYGNCPYCYARSIATRFEARKGCVLVNEDGTAVGELPDEAVALDRPLYFRNLETGERAGAPYPYGFRPTLHRYMLEDLAHIRGSKDIFVCSMSDLFGVGVPDEWIDEVFDACLATPRHRYFFLTKHPEAYIEYGVPIRKNMWYGTSITTRWDIPLIDTLPARGNTFVSLEPLLEDLEPERFNILFRQVDWIILGAETGRRHGKVIPQKEWVDKIVKVAMEYGTPLFMKESLLPVMGEKGMWRIIPSRGESSVRENENG